jgi:hypothetical protein
VNRTAQPVYLTLMAVLSLVLLGSCSSPTATATTTLMAISPTLTATTTPTVDPTAVAEASHQAQLDINKTQNAAYYATSVAKRTATSQARPPTATPTPRPATTPTDEGLGVLVDGILVHDANIRTGLNRVDRIIDVVLAGDMNEFRRMIRFTNSGCTQVMALGGPVKCREGEAEGTLVEVLPFLGAGEGSQLRRDELNNWQGIDVAGLYAVYRISDEAFSSQDYPAGEYGIVFRTKFPQDIVTLQAENGSILRIDSTFVQQFDPAFAIPPELNFERNAQEINLPPPNIKECPGASPQRVKVGEQASVCTQSEDLIMREEPGRDGKPLTGIETGTNFMIVDGPSCANNWSWWKVELDSGQEGWIAEGGDDIDPYFICPVD